jgi:TPR repeat protein
MKTTRAKKEQGVKLGSPKGTGKSKLDNCFNLGLSYEEGKGVKQDDFKALKFFQKACDLNINRFILNLGVFV